MTGGAGVASLLGVAPPRVVLVVAHPDDETVGAGALLGRLEDPTLVYVTDGAPRDPWFREQAGLPTRAAYAAVRATELERALVEGGVRARRVELGCVDQEAAFALAPLSRTLAKMLDTERPAIVLTHPYEGGHPDHDATAFAVAAAVRLCRPPAPLVVEMASYHASGGTLVAGDFIPGGPPVTTHALSPEERARKRRMLRSFATQARVLARFADDTERLRVAPSYDFSQPPHAGRLHYDGRGWPVDGARFCALAVEALEELGLTRSAADGAPRSG